MSFCLYQAADSGFYLVDRRRVHEFEAWLKWYNSVDKNSECFTDRFPPDNRQSLEPKQEIACKLSKPLQEYTFTDIKPKLNCGNKLECGSNCIDELGHDGDCLCAGDSDGESGTCPA